MRQTGLGLREVAEKLFDRIAAVKEDAMNTPHNVKGEPAKFANWAEFIYYFNGIIDSREGEDLPDSDNYAAMRHVANNEMYRLDTPTNRKNVSVHTLFTLRSVEAVHQFLLDTIWLTIIDRGITFNGRWKNPSHGIVTDRLMEAFSNVAKATNYFIEIDENQLTKYLSDIRNEEIRNSRVHYELFKVGYEAFVPGQISFYNILRASLQPGWWGSNLDLNTNVYSTNYYDLNAGKLIPSRKVSANTRTLARCKSCNFVVSYNTDTVTARPQGSSSNRGRVCMFCIMHRLNYINYWNVDMKRFEYRSGNLDSILTKVEGANVETLVPRLSLRVIKKYDYFDVFKTMCYSVPFQPDVTQRDYNYELAWRFWYIDEDAGIVRTSATNQFGNRVIDKETPKTDFGRLYLPIGMELELQARNDVRSDTTDLLMALHKEFPYGQSGMNSTRHQLAVGSYDGSLGQNGIEFKFQPMTYKFVDNLPQGFWDILQNQFRGFYNKRCGNHMNMPTGAFTREGLAIWIAWHNNAMLTYFQGNDDEYCVLEDIMQRTNPSYAAWSLVGVSEDAWTMKQEKSNDEDNYAAILLDDAKHSANRLYQGSTSGFARESLVNYKGQGRIEYRGFASATLKERIMKNYEFLTALHEYCEALGSTGINFNGAFPNVSESIVIFRHIANEHLFYEWVVQTRAHKYPYLTKYVQSVIMPRIEQVSHISSFPATQEELNYVEERA